MVFSFAIQISWVARKALWRTTKRLGSPQVVSMAMVRSIGLRSRLVMVSATWPFATMPWRSGASDSLVKWAQCGQV